MLGKFGNINAVNYDASAINGINARNHIKHSGFTCSVTSDDGYEIALVKFKVDTVKRFLFVNCAGVKGFMNILNLQHITLPPLRLLHEFRHSVHEDTEYRGKSQQQRQSKV